jgi:FkbM family methyltransferase
MTLKTFIVTNLPSLGKYKRAFVALRDTYIRKQTYSQHGEDVFLERYVKEQTIDVKRYLYIDVGANHPTEISNTYLLYGLGMRGVIIEPNRELVRLFHWFRREDRALEIGVSNENSVHEFHISKTPVISSFRKNWMSGEIAKTIYVPMLTLDNAVGALLDKPIFLLSIDVEGLNLEVLEGANATVRKSRLLCIEYDEPTQIGQIQDRLGSDFTIIGRFGCNLIFENRALILQKV